MIEYIRLQSFIYEEIRLKKKTPKMTQNCLLNVQVIKCHTQKRQLTVKIQTRKRNMSDDEYHIKCQS